jgi:hypothetical protein
VALYAKTSGSAPTYVMGNIKINNVLNTSSNFDGQVRLLADEYDQSRILEGSFYTRSKSGSLPIATLNAANTKENSVFKWVGGELDTAYQVNSWRSSEIVSPVTDYDKTIATFNAKTGLLKVDYIRSDKDRNLYQVMSTAYAVVNQRKNSVNGFYSRVNWEGGSFSVIPNSQKLKVPQIAVPDAPLEVAGVVTSIKSTIKTIGAAETTYKITVKGIDNWYVTVPETVDWLTAKVVNNDGSVWADNLTGRGNAKVEITVLANQTSTNRKATINIGGKEHVLTQGTGEATSMTPQSKVAIREGEFYTLDVKAQGVWKAIPEVDWLAVIKVVNEDGYLDPLSPSNTGSGNATITIQVLPNDTESPRLDGVIDIGGLKHTVKQEFY